jgi:hypothetical protein
MSKQLPDENQQDAALSGLPPWMAKMRSAAQRAISEADVEAMVQAQVKKAKEGDDKALSFIFNQVLGGSQIKGATFIQNNYGNDERPDKPTAARPGTADKVDLMRRRVASGNGAFVEGDGGKVDLS